MAEQFTNSNEPVTADKMTPLRITGLYGVKPINFDSSLGIFLNDGTRILERPVPAVPIIAEENFKNINNFSHDVSLSPKTPHGMTLSDHLNILSSLSDMARIAKPELDALLSEELGEVLSKTKLVVSKGLAMRAYQLVTTLSSDIDLMRQTWYHPWIVATSDYGRFSVPEIAAPLMGFRVADDTYNGAPIIEPIIANKSGKTGLLPRRMHLPSVGWLGYKRVPYGDEV